MACGLLISFLIGRVGGKAKVFFWVSVIVPGSGFGRCIFGVFLVAAAASVRFPVPFLCERVGIPVGGCFDGAAAGGSSDYCSVRSLASWSMMEDFSSPLLSAELLVDIRSTISICLDDVSGQWLLWRFHGVELLCRRGGGSCFAPACVGDDNG
jgi:hypothetical protein